MNKNTKGNQGFTPGTVNYDSASCGCNVITVPSIYTEQAVEIEYCSIHAAASELLDRVYHRLDRCNGHAVQFNPNDESHEGRGGCGCSDCEADLEAIANATQGKIGE